MRETLLKIQARLDNTLDYLPMKSATERAIYILTSNEVPEITDYPAIGIKDGDENYDLEGGTMADGAEFDQQMEVVVTAFVEMLRKEEVIVGDGSGMKGILEVADDIKASLNGFDLGEGYTAPLILKRGKACQAMSSDTVSIWMKEMFFACSKQYTI